MLPVLCFPFAGAGAAAFRRCQEFSARRVRVVPIELPGRATRFAEPPYTTVSEAVDGLHPEIVELLGDEREVALFGHSLGAVLAFEMALRLESSFTVRGVFVSGSPGPWTRRARRASGLSDGEFLDRVKDLAGHSHPALEDPELREMLLPVLRADVEMHEAYLAAPDVRLDAPLFSIRGAEDELVSTQQAAQWAGATTGAFRAVEVPGGHMYVADDPLALVRLVDDLLPEPVSP
ncbi:thioesterase II family protein [Lentzea aerocolonigenes]|uniref:thioesterase II family protein n=1 Tax=Lentzea aerocolonigenes TaxID=68170 RepID=UPI0004C471DE|nr:alpha/beta fold hydrolase [Lentzea aerocolonigenes]MCP2243419.1 Surfactin synthase thioesterase subunit [Lentzea aerocolonigenes]